MRILNSKLSKQKAVFPDSFYYLQVSLFSFFLSAAITTWLSLRLRALRPGSSLRLVIITTAALFGLLWLLSLLSLLTLGSFLGWQSCFWTLISWWLLLLRFLTAGL
jgi:hypothetical protein